MRAFRSSLSVFACGAVLSLVLAACDAGSALRPRVPEPSAVARTVIPAQGQAATLDIANWNLEWFGDAANGPSNEPLQLANVKDVIGGTDADIWGLEEVVSNSQWNSLLAGLPGYAGVLASDASVTSGSSFYTASEQKPALIYKTSVATVTSAKLILTGNDSDFAGRPPLEVKLNVTLNGTTQPLVVIVQHLKAFNDVTSWQRRQNAAVALKSYLDATYPTQKVIVVGDWNDDVDTSITAGEPSPFANFVADPSRYTFPTKALTDAGIASTVSYTDFIDHQLDTNEMFASYVAGSAKVYRVDSYIASYGTTTTDHYPVLSRYNWGSTGTSSVTVTSPNGGESWVAGSSHALTWTSAGVANVKLEYTLNGGTSWSVITSSTPASAGTFTWTVPSTATTTAKVRVTDAAVATTTDVSNAAFTITASGGTANVVINEILANEPGSSTSGEFVELVNTGSASASIGGWTISDGTAVRHTFAAGTTLAAGQAIVVFGGAASIPAGLTNAVAASTGDLNLANGGDSAILKDGGGVVKNSFTFTSSLSGTDGVSMNRNPDASATGSFVLHTTLSSLSSSAGKRVNGTAF